MALVISWLISAVVILLASYLLPGISIAGFVTALIVALVLGLVNAFIKPILLILTLPINILTLGLFTLVINAVLILLVAAIVPGFQVAGFIWALLFGLILSAVMYLVGKVDTVR
ncbi:MAG TPA: hypothetical protein DIT25_01520 [Candidatus Moranbacteria bacterium]|nr:hypothetical protein [Candidatus Moranbacteria bacterium]